MGCCDDPREPVKISRSDLVRVQEQYGTLLRDLFTGDPEKVMLKQLNETSVYLQELAAANAHYDSVRVHAIKLLKKESLSILQRIVDKEPDSTFSQYALLQIDSLNK